MAASRELNFMEVDAAPAEDVTTFNASAMTTSSATAITEVERGGPISPAECDQGRSRLIPSGW